MAWQRPDVTRPRAAAAGGRKNWAETRTASTSSSTILLVVTHPDCIGKQPKLPLRRLHENHQRVRTFGIAGLFNAAPTGCYVGASRCLLHWQALAFTAGRRLPRSGDLWCGWQGLATTMKGLIRTAIRSGWRDGSNRENTYMAGNCGPARHGFSAWKLLWLAGRSNSPTRTGALQATVARDPPFGDWLPLGYEISPVSTVVASTTDPGGRPACARRAHSLFRGDQEDTGHSPDLRYRSASGRSTTTVFMNFYGGSDGQVMMSLFTNGPCLGGLAKYLTIGTGREPGPEAGDRPWWSDIGALRSVILFILFAERPYRAF